jgi:hypothetical protein
MKLITAIVRPEKLGELIEVLVGRRRSAPGRGNREPRPDALDDGRRPDLVPGQVLIQQAGRDLGPSRPTPFSLP